MFVFAEGKFRGGVLSSLQVGLALLRTVNPVEANTLRVLVVQDFDGVRPRPGLPRLDTQRQRQQERVSGQLESCP